MLYLCAVKDVFSNRIVGHSIDIRMKSSLAVSAIRNAIALRSPDGTICHSDRGSQFRSRKVVRLLKENGLQGSMGRVGSAGDNASMESFYSLLQKNVLSTRTWDTRDQLRHAIVYWIEAKYNRRRRQRGLGKLTPVEYETVHQSAMAGSKTLKPALRVASSHLPAHHLPTRRARPDRSDGVKDHRKSPLSITEIPQPLRRLFEAR